MSSYVSRWIESRSLRSHLWIALALGLLFRLCSAWFVFGPQALDDYLHGVLPALRLLDGEPSGLPDYRSPLLVWMLAGFARVATLFGCESDLSMVRAMYVGLGLASLLAVVGVYLYVVRRGSVLFGALAIYLTALHPLMSFVGTRAFGEAVALEFIMLGIGLVEWARLSRPARWETWVTLGFFTIGIATLFRFQAGVIFVAYGAVMILLREWRIAALGVVAGFATLASQVAVDLIAHRAALGTLTAYIAANEGGAASFGVMPWYNTWAVVLFLTLFPFSIVFWNRLGGLWREHWPMLVPLLLFVTVHSLVPHKEERFLYPIFALCWVALAYVWAAKWEHWGVRWIYSPAFALFVLATLPLALFMNTQSGTLETASAVSSRFPSALYLDYEPPRDDPIKAYFLRAPSRVERPTELPDLAEVERALQSHPELKAVVLMSNEFSDLSPLQGIRSSIASCGTLNETGSAVDRWLYHHNPEFNARRRPLWFLVCEGE